MTDKLKVAQADLKKELMVMHEKLKAKIQEVMQARQEEIEERTK